MSSLKIVSRKRTAAALEANSLGLRRTVIALVVILGLQMAVKYVTTYLIKESVYDSILTRVQELVNRHATRLCEALGMAKPVFLQLYRELQGHCGFRNSKYLGLAEKAPIFL